MKKIKVSVIVPVYKIEEPLLRGCLDSLAAQTLADIEILTVDDGCPVGGGDICAEYARRYEDFVLIRQENRGVSAARNAGLDAARGEYVTFVDGDDLVDPDYCRILYETAVAEQADIVSSRVARWTPEKGTPPRAEICGRTVVYRRPEEIRTITLSLLRTMAMNRQDLWVPENHYSCAHMFRVECIKGIRFNEVLTGGEDKLFNYHALLRCRIFCRREERLYHYVLRNTSATCAFHPDSAEKAPETYALYRALPEVKEDAEFRNAYYIRTCCMTLAMSHAHFRHPDNPDRRWGRAFRQYCRRDVVAESIRKADVRKMRLCKMKVAILLLKVNACTAAAMLADLWKL